MDGMTTNSAELPRVRDKTNMAGYAAKTFLSLSRACCHMVPCALGGDSHGSRTWAVVWHWTPAADQHAAECLPVTSRFNNPRIYLRRKYESCDYILHAEPGPGGLLFVRLLFFE
jgi:hypothetical protein